MYVIIAASQALFTRPVWLESNLYEVDAELYTATFMNLFTYLLHLKHRLMNMHASATLDAFTLSYH